MLLPGDPAPFFAAPSSVNPDFHFDTVAGRYVVLSFLASSKVPYAARLLEEVARRRERFNVTDLLFCGVTSDPQDVQKLPSDAPGVIYFWDLDFAVGGNYGVLSKPAAPTPSTAPSDAPSSPEAEARAEPEAAPGAEAGRQNRYQPQTFVLDPALRVLAVVPFDGEPAAHLDEVLSVVDQAPRLDAVAAPAPVLAVPYVFEPELCRRLIDYYVTHGGRESGFMRDVDGKTVAVMDHAHKRRADCDIADQSLVRATQERLLRRVVPAIRQAFQFHVTRIERHIVACYDAADGGHFRAHRDNTTLGTAHRRFAVTLNLNAEEFEGGELWFPEFSRRRYKAATGGAIVFSCSLLHEATPVTKGRRYAFLPFLYDDAAAKVREQNRRHLAVAAAAPTPTPASGG